jgi:TrbL/VirB6 plasmid conjugal transfer protein
LLVIGAMGALLGLPAVVQAAVFPAHAAAGSARVAPARTTASPGLAAVQLPAQPLAPSGGICSVPGIGDIGGLLGFCTAGSSGIIGDLNNICQPSVPTPEPATGGIDALISPAPSTTNTKQPATLYDSYGMAGQSWAAYDLQCSDMASLVGNNIAGVVFDAAKAMDRVTITVYQSAAGTGILSWLTGAVDKLITSLGNAIYFPYLAPVVILGAIWLAWQGLIRKRASRTIEGTIWMVVACAAAIWLIGRPADFTGAGKAVSDGITQALNVAFAKLPAPHQSSCVPLAKADPQSPPLANYAYTNGNNIVDTNANELWTVLVCKPWLDGEFGTTAYATGKGHPTVVNTYGRQLLWSQAIAVNEKQTASVIQAKQDAYAGLAAQLKKNDPGVYPLFQGKQWTTRLEIAFAALFAALLAGVLVLLIAITLILLKLGFLLLLVAGPFFLIIGTHPGYGRVIALRWGELLIGVLLKQAAIAVVLSVLLYAYALIMGTSDTVLPWALKILMISLVTVAVFIYRRPFTHLFSAVGYGVIGSRDAADTHLARATSSGVRNTVDAATVALPGFAAYRVARWARRNPAQAASVTAQVATAGAASAAAGAAAAANGSGADGAAGEAAGAETGPDGTPQAAGASAAASVAARGRARTGSGGTGGRTPPPLDLPSRTEDAGAPRPPSGWARNGPNGSLTAAPGSTWPGSAPRSAGGSPGPAPRPSGPGPLAGSSGNGRPPPPASRQAPPPRTAPPAPRSAPPAPRSAPPAPRSAPPAPRSAPPARRNSPPPAPSPRPPRHTAPRHPAAPPPQAASGQGGSPQRPGPDPRAGSNGSRPEDPAARFPFWLRPMRRRK